MPVRCWMLILPQKAFSHDPKIPNICTIYSSYTNFLRLLKGSAQEKLSIRKSRLSSSLQLSLKPFSSGHSNPNRTLQPCCIPSALQNIAYLRKSNRSRLIFNVLDGQKTKLYPIFWKGIIGTGILLHSHYRQFVLDGKSPYDRSYPKVQKFC